MDRELLEQEIIRDEGKRLEAYTDSVGLWTIGVGHLLGSRKRMDEITEGECRALLRYDLAEAEVTARKFVPRLYELDDVRQRAIVNMAFNLGGRVAGFRKFLAAVDEGDWDKAALEMADSRWATQVGQRAVRLQTMIRTGEAA